MFKGFKEFILRGNVIDLAVAVVIGAAFTALIGAVNTALIQPVVNAFFALLGIGKDSIGGTINLAGNQQINLGAIVSAAITFLITALVVYYVFVVPVNKAKSMFAKDEVEEETTDSLLAEIRDLLKDGQDKPGGSASR